MFIESSTSIQDRPFFFSFFVSTLRFYLCSVVAKNHRPCHGTIPAAMASVKLSTFCSSFRHKHKMRKVALAPSWDHDVNDLTVRHDLYGRLRQPSCRARVRHGHGEIRVEWNSSLTTNIQTPKSNAGTPIALKSSGADFADLGRPSRAFQILEL
jgi:hypothetical protein